MKAKIDKKKNVIIIEVPLQTPKQSKSGKTMVIAAAQGNTGETLDGKSVYISLNAYYKK